jgi:hypothetical protein
MQTPWLRLAYAAEFLIAVIAVFTGWSQVGGQGHLDIMAWYWKLGLGLGMSWAIVRMTAAAMRSPRALNRQSLAWFIVILGIAAAMAAVTVYYHLNEEIEEPQEEEGVTATWTRRPVATALGSERLRSCTSRRWRAGRQRTGSAA